MLVRNPNAAHDGCRILYRDVGDHLTRERKLAFLRETESIAGIDDWREIVPDRHHDWIGQRSEEFGKLYPIGSRDAKAGKTDEAIFSMFSNGYKSGRDVSVYNFSRDACAENAHRMVDEYTAALREWKTSKGNAAGGIESVTRRYSADLRWDRELKRRIRQQAITTFCDDHIREVIYRPFVRQYLYADYTFSQAPGQTRALFPDDACENRAICVTGTGSTKPFSAVIVDAMPDLELVSKGQCFPRYRYQRSENAQDKLPGLEPELERVDNITDTALRTFQIRYGDNSITKDAIFDYVYAVLHHPHYHERFANDLIKELPRVPFAADFHTFAEAGRKLANLHLQYESCDEYPLDVDFSGSGDPRPEHFTLGSQAMRFIDEKRTSLRINDQVCLRGIPDDAHRYQVNGRTPLEWFIDRYRIVRDRESGIVNDPNGWFDDPRNLIAAIRRVVHVGVETSRIVAMLPEPLANGESDPASAFRAEAHRHSLIVAGSAQEREDQAFVDAISDWNHE